MYCNAWLLVLILHYLSLLWVSTCRDVQINKTVKVKTSRKNKWQAKTKLVSVHCRRKICPVLCELRKSQNSRGWKGPLGIIMFNCHAKEGSLQYVTQTGIQAGLKHPQRRRNHNLSGKSVSVLCHPHCEKLPLHIGAERLRWVWGLNQDMKDYSIFCLFSLPHPIF